MSKKINIYKVIEEVQNSYNLLWEREEGNICVDTQTENYSLTICKHTGINKISYYIHSNENYLEDHCSPSKDQEAYASLIQIYDYADQNAINQKTA